ncbi:alginate lyase family protein [Neobacillus bataviensis]|uniref:alginate lyase family protein n=1 Tax=Neobacillus bataviensis TaxID=220685 RepID=UPI001CBC3BBA|nr:alginate lyase family protein [Neobacillus bataviensis]
MDNKIILYVNTVRYLKPSQIYYRLFNRFKRELYKRKLLSVNVPANLEIGENRVFIIPELDFDKEFLNRFDINDIMSNRFTFINLTNQVKLSTAWNQKELQHLWRYNLHYFEYLFTIAYEYLNGKNRNVNYEKYRGLITNWIENNPYAFGDGWHPYTISLRITNWIITYQIFKDEIIADNDFDKRIKESIYLQYKYLQTNLEKDVLGNHYFENIKALIIGSVFFDEVNVKNKFKKELLKQLKEQILKDGMHFELSPMYHKIILEDLIKITFWLNDEEIYHELISYIQKMVDVTYSLESNFGKTPAFNDSANGVSKNFKCLLKVCNKYFRINPQNISLKKSGFYIVEDQSRKLIFDTGDICPSYLPAHGHCDALSFELSINGSPLFVNSGTFQYENGQWRNFFRSTKAHNTVSISELEQSQFWGSFRIAKRIKKVRRKQFIYKGIQFYAGAYVSYLGVEHKRFIGYLDEDTVIVLDFVNSKIGENVNSYLHFAPKTKVDLKNTIALANKGKTYTKITPFGINRMTIGQGWYSEEFNIKEQNKHLVFHKEQNGNYFGYLIDTSSKDMEIIESKKGIRIICNKELMINYDELGDIL